MSPRAWDGYQQLLKRLDAARRRLRATRVMTGVCYWLAAVLGVGAVALAADNLFRLPAEVRLGILLGYAAVVLGGLALWVVRPVVRRLSDDDMALYVQNKHGKQLSNTLINAVQIGRDSDPGPAPFVDALVRESEKAAEGCDFRSAVDRRGLRRGGVIALACVLGTVVYALVLPTYFANAGQRMLSPYSDVQPVGVPRLVVEPGDAIVCRGGHVKITATITAAKLQPVPTEAVLQFETDEGRLDSRRLAVQADGRTGQATYTFHKVAKPFRYRVVLPQIESPQYRVNVVSRPAVVGIGMTYDYPDYTGLADRQVDSADGYIEAVVGTTVRLEIASNKPMQQCELHCRWKASGQDNNPVDQKIVPTLVWGADGAAKLARAELTLQRSGAYRVHITDTDGLTNNGSAAKRIVARPDTPPDVELVSPDRLEVRLAPTDKLKVAIEAKDDFALRSVRFVTVLGEGRPDEARRWDVPADERRPFLATQHVLDLALTGLKVGDVVTLYAEATDNNTLSGPGRGQSRKYKISIVDPAQLKAEQQQRRRTGATDLRQLLAEQKLTRATVEGLAGDMERRQLRLQKARTQVEDPIQWQAGHRADCRAITEKLKGDGSPLVPALARLSDGPMVQAVGLLEQARNSGVPTEMSDRLNDAHRVQTTIVDELERMLRRAERAEAAVGVYDVLKTLSELLNRQQELRAETVGEAPRARLLADRQRTLSADTGEAEKMLDTTSQALEASSVELAAAFKKAHQEMCRRKIPGKMTDSATQLDAQALSPSAKTQTGIIADLEAVIGIVTQALADNAARNRKRLREAMEKMARKARDMMELEKKIDAMTRDLDRKPEDRLTDEDRKKLEDMAELQSRLADAAEKSSKDAKILPKHEWSDEMAKCWEEVRKFCEADAEALKKEPTTKVIPLNKKILEALKKTEEAAKNDKPDPEGVLSSKPDRTKIKTENFKPEDLPLIKPGAVPEKIKDLVGNLVDKLEDQTDDVEDETSNWAKKNSTSGLAIDGPMSTFGGKGQTGNRIPDPAELTGRSGAGRAGKASGELIEGETKNIPGGKSPPPRRTNDPYQKGEVKDNNPDQPSGATGGGKKGGLGEEGLEGKKRFELDDPGLEKLAQRQMQLRQTTQKLVNTFGLLNLPVGQLPEAVRLMKDVEDDLVARRFEGTVAKQRAALTALKQSYRALAGSGYVEISAPGMSRQLQKEMHDAIERGFPDQYRSLLEAYYKSLSSTEQ